MIAYESEHVRLDGTNFPVAVELMATLDGLEGALRWLTWVDDLTERRRAEEAAARHAGELARSNADLDRFAAVVAHDLQSPLRVIVGSARILERRAARAPGRRGARARRADRQRRAADGRARRRDPRVLGRARRTSRSRTRCRAQTWSTRSSPRWRRAGGRGRERRRRRPPGGLRRRGRARAARPEPARQRAQVPPARAARDRHGRRAAPTAATWLVTVADNGIGIAPAYAERVFGFGDRLHTDDAIGGTGIGLAVLQDGRGAPRRAHLGRARAGRRQRVPLHAAGRRVAEARGAQRLDHRERLLVRARGREQRVERPARGGRRRARGSPRRAGAGGRAARGDRHRDAGLGDRADRERVADDEHEVRLEARGAAGVDDEAVARRCHPRVVAQLAQRDPLAAGQPVAGAEHGEHRLLGEHLAPEPAVVARRRGGVLEGHGDVEPASADAVGESGQRALLHRDLEVGPRARSAAMACGPRPRRARWGRRRAGACAGRRPPAHPSGRRRARAARRRRRHGRAAAGRRPWGARRRGPGRAARPELALERARPAGRPPAGSARAVRRAGERAHARDGAEGEQPAGVEHSCSLSIPKEDHWSLWLAAATLWAWTVLPIIAAHGRP